MLTEYKSHYSRRLAKKLSERGKRMAKVRWEKWRNESHLRQEPEPKMERWFQLELGVRDKITGEVAWTDFKSVRDAAKRLSIIQKYYK